MSTWGLKTRRSCKVGEDMYWPTITFAEKIGIVYSIGLWMHYPWECIERELKEKRPNKESCCAGQLCGVGRGTRCCPGILGVLLIAGYRELQGDSRRPPPLKKNKKQKNCYLFTTESLGRRVRISLKSFRLYFAGKLAFRKYFFTTIRISTGNEVDAHKADMYPQCPVPLFFWDRWGLILHHGKNHNTIKLEECMPSEPNASLPFSQATTCLISFI